MAKMTLAHSRKPKMSWGSLSEKSFFLTKKVNKQLKSLSVRKESPQSGHLRKKVVFYKSCIFSYIGKTKNFLGRFGNGHCNDVFQNTKLVSGLLTKMFKNGKNDLGTFKKT
jgi:hypothetical protein